MERRDLLLLSAGAAAVGLGGCARGPARNVSASSPATDPSTPATVASTPSSSKSRCCTASPTTTPSSASPEPSSSPSSQMIGDGSTSFTGPQPRQRPISKLKPGEIPPQFVVISWDGCAELASGQLTRFRKAALDTDANMTLFLSGLYMLPERLQHTYRSPGRRKGASAIGLLGDASLRRTITGIGKAWTEGHEVGTHFNGHFCGPRGVGSWTSAMWNQEIEEAMRFVMTWKTTSGFKDIPALPFDYRKELVGSRTPCLEGAKALMPVAAKRGWRYDSSQSKLQTWPIKNSHGLWDLSMTMVPFPGHSFEAIPMDYTYMANQSKQPVTDRTHFATWRAQVLGSLQAGLERSRNSNRAPLLIGNHFEQWNGGIYMDAVEDFMRWAHNKPGVELVSFRWLCDWLDAQDPAMLARLQKLSVGCAPKGGWKTVVR